jgi:hypothetical protein
VLPAHVSIALLGRLPSLKRLAMLMVVALYISACATPVGVVRVDPRQVHAELSASVLSTGNPSSFSALVLRRLSLYEQFHDRPDETLQQLHRGLLAQDDEDRLLALAELSFFHAENSGNRSYFLASAVYAYTFLFPEGLGTPPHPADSRLRLALDLYSRAITEGVASPDDETVLLKAGRYPLPFGALSVAAPEGDFLWAGYRMTHCVAMTNFAVRGLRNHYRHPGIGAPVSAMLVPTEGVQTARCHCSNMLRSITAS